MSNSRNPYIDDSGIPKLKQSVVAFIDILGYQEIIRNAEKDGSGQISLEEIYKALSEGKKWLSGKHIEGIGPKDVYAISTFTDNIVIGYPISDDAECELGDIYSKLAYFQLTMVMSGFFIRGAISIGDIYIDDIAVYGSGLILAYDAEHTLARDPRIILTHSARDVVEKHITYYKDAHESPQYLDLYKDADGQYFLNYLDCILIAEYEQGPFYKELEKHKLVVENKLSQYQSNPSIWSKYSWVANYHNYFCSQHTDYFNDTHKIDLSMFQMQPSRIVKE